MVQIVAATVAITAGMMTRMIPLRVLAMRFRGHLSLGQVALYLGTRALVKMRAMVGMAPLARRDMKKPMMTAQAPVQGQDLAVALVPVRRMGIVPSTKNARAVSASVGIALHMWIARRVLQPMVLVKFESLVTCLAVPPVRDISEVNSI